MRVVRAALCAGLVCMLLAPIAAADTEVLLDVDRETVRAGGTLRVRIENSSPNGVGYGRAYALARWSRGKDRWVKVPVDRIFSQDLLSVAAGGVSPWEPVEIGAGAPGRYRVQKSYMPYMEGRLGKPVTLTATFEVKPAAPR